MRGLWRGRLQVSLAMLPAWIIVIGVFIGAIIWTFVISMTNSRLIPIYKFNFFDQYVRLMNQDAWLVSAGNLVVFGVLFIVVCLVLGFLMAIMMDQKIRAESLFRTIFLYPYAMSFVVTGLVWQWVLNPTFGIQATARGWGFDNFVFDWIVQPDRAIFVLVLAAVWQGSGLVMAILLAGLRGVDEDLWKATKVDGIAKWRVYTSIILPIIAPMAATATVLLSVSVVKAYDLVVALTGGGPGNATEVPAKFVMENLFERQNVALANAGAIMMLAAVVIIATPIYYARRIMAQKASG
ncbi:sugar ABC transporter permease [Rhizobium leguminosarum]|uniref:carbohydrate ABC transporter permease n=2 Tax=Rhizobium leguminosarum TaxID=384 RepID=UPI002F92AFC5